MYGTSKSSSWRASDAAEYPGRGREVEPRFLESQCSTGRQTTNKKEPPICKAGKIDVDDSRLHTCSSFNSRRARFFKPLGPENIFQDSSRSPLVDLPLIRSSERDIDSLPKLVTENGWSEENFVCRWIVTHKENVSHSCFCLCPSP